MAAWRRYRLTDQDAWTAYQAKSKAAYELLQQRSREAYDRCEQLAMTSMAQFRVAVSAWYAAENGIETDLDDDSLTDPETAWNDHLARVSQAVRVRESATADMRADYRVASTAAVSQYQHRLIQARHQWLDACRGGNGRHGDPYAA